MNRKVLRVLTWCVMCIPLVLVEFQKITTADLAIVKGFTVGMAINSVSWLYSKVQYNEPYTLLPSLVFLTVFVMANSLDFADPENYEWLTGAIIVGIIILFEVARLAVNRCRPTI